MKSVNKNQKWLREVVGFLGICVTLFISTDAAANVAEAAPAVMPVKEITIFKDGHAFVLHEGKMPAGTDKKKIAAMAAAATVIQMHQK